MTFMIGVPTGVKIFNWLGTLWRGSITFEPPMLFALGFVSMFLIGGINGTFSAAVPVDFAIHDTYFVVAHIHYVLFGGSVFAVFAGLYYWFPKIWGRRLNDTLGQIHFALMFIGFNLDLLPHASARPGWHAAPHRDLLKQHGLGHCSTDLDDRARSSSPSR